MFLLYVKLLRNPLFDLLLRKGSKILFLVGFEAMRHAS